MRYSQPFGKVRIHIDMHHFPVCLLDEYITENNEYQNILYENLLDMVKDFFRTLKIS